MDAILGKQGRPLEAPGPRRNPACDQFHLLAAFQVPLSSSFLPGSSLILKAASSRGGGCAVGPRWLSMGGSRAEVVEGGGMIPLVTGPRNAQLRRGPRRIRAAKELSISGGAAAGLPLTPPSLTTHILTRSRTAARLSLLLIFGLVASAFSGVRSVGAHMVRSSVDGRLTRCHSWALHARNRNLESLRLPTSHLTST